MRKLSIVSFVLLAGLLIGAKGCGADVVASVDQESYNVGGTGISTLENMSRDTVYLPGCSAFFYQKLEGVEWIDVGPSVVCVWEGNVKPLLSGESFSSDFQAMEVGTWRLRYTIGRGCTAGKPMSQAGCHDTMDVYTPRFEVVPNENNQGCIDSGGSVETSLCCESASDFPNLCLIGACGCSPEYSHSILVCQCPEGMCFDGTACVSIDSEELCASQDCGPSMGMPNTLCDDGKTVAGPTGRCLRHDDGSCGWEVISCPAAH